MKISLVEDEKSLLEMIQFNLELEGYDVVSYMNGLTAFNDMEKIIKTDLIVMDVMLPGMNGLELCKAIRKVSSVPIIILSAKGTTIDRVGGLKSGANDYLPKPFDLEEFILKVQILLQKNSIKTTIKHYEIGLKTINFETFEIIDNSTNEQIGLSKREMELLQLFFTHENQVISRNQILDEVWGKDQFPTSRTIDNYILNFRKIFEKNQKNPIHFQSIRGVGYKFQK